MGYDETLNRDRFESDDAYYEALRREAEAYDERVHREYADMVDSMRFPDFPINLFGLYSCPVHGRFHVVWFNDVKKPRGVACCPACGSPLSCAK